MNITIVIISYRSLEKLTDCIKNIGKNINIIVIENSNLESIKKSIENNFNNCKVILNNSNLGYAEASNIGFKLVKTKYAFLLNTDIVISEKQINKIESEIALLKDDFSLASPYSDDFLDFNKNNKIDKFFGNIPVDFDNEKVSKVELVKGCSLLVNLEKFIDKDIFDKNYFFFFEEIDLCRNIKKKGENIFVLNQVKIEHKNAKSVNENLNLRYQDFRHWNYFWGRFYYFKKHYGFLYSLIIHLGKLIRFSFNILRYYFISKPLYIKNKFRFLGLFNSIIGRSSKISVKILEE